jgi:hypothetical protein
MCKKGAAQPSQITPDGHAPPRMPPVSFRCVSFRKRYCCITPAGSGRSRSAAEAGALDSAPGWAMVGSIPLQASKQQESPNMNNVPVRARVRT